MLSARHTLICCVIILLQNVLLISAWLFCSGRSKNTVWTSILC